MSNAKTTDVTMAVYAEHWPANELESTISLCSRNHKIVHQGLWIQSGSLTSDGTYYKSGDGLYIPPDSLLIQPANASVNVLRFVFSTLPSDAESLTAQLMTPLDQAPPQDSLRLCKTFSAAPANAVLRLDQVDFQPGTVAYRHTHPGGGLRYLTLGSLRLEADHAVHTVMPGEAWFEGANSPVKAVSDTNQPSQFVRMMILPAEYQGRSSFTLASESDADKPRLQTNHRFFDMPISVEAP